MNELMLADSIRFHIKSLYFLISFFPCNASPTYFRIVLINNFKMLLRQARVPVQRVANTARTLSARSFPSSRALAARACTPFSPLNLLPVVSFRSYANGRPHPPGGTHRMDMGGGENEKSALEQYGVDLTERARAGKLDPVIGRDAEIHRTIQVLSRRTKNNPVLIGSAGTGKTASKYCVCNSDEAFADSSLISTGRISPTNC